MSETASLATLVAWASSHGYFLIFLAAAVEGPIVALAAAFAAALGYLDVRLVFIVSFLGDFIPDLVLYGAGYLGREKAIERWLTKHGSSQVRVRAIEKMIHRNSTRSTLVIKLTPLLATPGLLLLGAARVDFKKFSAIAIIVTTIRSLCVVATGFYLGKGYSGLETVLEYKWALLFIALLAGIGIVRLYEKLTGSVAAELEKEENVTLPLL